MRELVEHHLPAECRERDTWRQVADRMNEAARGGNIDDAVITLRLVLQLERVPRPRFAAAPFFNDNLA